jgi:hypothetical protein
MQALEACQQLSLGLEFIHFGGTLESVIESRRDVWQ